MKSLSRIPGWWLATACAALALVGVSQRALASGGVMEAPRKPFTFTVTAPVNGYTIVAGSTITITWTSSNPNQNVNISLVNDPGWFVERTVVNNTADDGHFVWTVPSDVPAGQYLIYIENVGVTDWTYGPTFDILECGSSLQQQSQPGTRPATDRPMPRLRPAPRDGRPRQERSPVPAPPSSR